MTQLDAKWIPITNEITLHENDLLDCWKVIDGEKCLVIYRVLGDKSEYLEGMVPIQEMSRSGKALKENERNTVSVPFNHFIENKFSLLLDKSHDQMNWPKSFGEAVLKLKLQFTEKQLLEIQQLSKEEFDSKYLTVGYWIRNHFGLWRGNFTLLLDCDKSNPEPDHVSEVIIEKFWKYLQK